MIWFLPLEPLEERYTTQMTRWVIEGLIRRKLPYECVWGEALAEETEGDQFLPWASRAHYACSQSARVARLFHDGRVKPGDVFFLADFWTHGLETIAYLRDLMHVPVKLFAFQHAGPFDKTDVTRPILSWGKYQEAAWYAACDGVFVGSEHLARTIAAGLAVHRLTPPDRLIVTGLPWEPSEPARVAEPWCCNPTMRPMVIWPHRLSPDKDPKLFFQIVDAASTDHPDVRWIITSGRRTQRFTPSHPKIEFIGGLSKAKYYHLLGQASLMLSTARHENWGFTIREATTLGTPILCPARACYPEMILSPQNLYKTPLDALVAIDDAIAGNLHVATLKQQPGLEAILDALEGKTPCT